MEHLEEGKTVKLLLVEDDRDFCIALSARLEKRNVDVTPAYSGEEAIKKLQENGFDIIVADIKLPGMPGTDFLEKVREVNKNLPVILLTGYASLESAREAIKLNASDYLLKPLENIEELLSPIKSAVYSYRLYKDNEKLCSALQYKMLELEKSEREYKKLFELASDGLCTVLPTGEIVSMNKKMEEIIGDTRENIKGKPLSDFVCTAEEKIKSEKIFREVIDGKFSGEIEICIITKAAEKCIGEMGMSPFVFEDGTVGVECVIRDITLRKETEKKLQEAYVKLHETRGQLFQSEKMKVIGLMANGIAHEIKNPLSAILQGISYLEGKLAQKKNEDILNTLHMMKENMYKAEAIISTLIDFSTTSGKLSVKKVPVRKIIEKALILVNPRIGKKKIKISKDFEENLPDVIVDEKHIEQVFVNIFLNSIQAIHGKGSISIRVNLTEFKNAQGIVRDARSTVTLPGKYVRIEIEDTGEGIKKEHLDKIFDPFFTTKAYPEKAGLGLAISKNIIEMHNGLIKASNKNGNTRIEVILKAAE